MNTNIVVLRFTIVVCLSVAVAAGKNNICLSAQTFSLRTYYTLFHLIVSASFNSTIGITDTQLWNSNCDSKLELETCFTPYSNYSF